MLPLFRITMITPKQVKNKEEFSCNNCDFKCYYKSEYNRHIETVKHKKITNDNIKQVENKKAHSCQCGKKYKHPSGLSRHKLKCNESGVTNELASIDETTNLSAFVMDLISQNKELMNLLVVQNQENKEMHKTIKEILPKMGNNNTTTNNNTNNNQFNLQVFLNEDCKDALNFSEFIEQIQISFQDLENQAENGYVKGISKLFIENLQGLGTHKRPIHCTDKKRKTLYIKENNTWDKEGSQDTLKKGIREVTGRTYGELIKSQAENEEEYKDADSVFSNKCLIIQQNLVPNYPRETSIGKVIDNITQNTRINEK
jgi:hypothetical protein